MLLLEKEILLFVLEVRGGDNGINNCEDLRLPVSILLLLIALPIPKVGEEEGWGWGRKEVVGKEWGKWAPLDRGLLGEVEDEE